MNAIKYKMYKLCFVIIAYCLLGSNLTQAFDTGGAGPGGGDPYVQQFIHGAHQLAYFFKSNPNDLQLNFDPFKFEAQVKELEISIRREDLPDQLSFTDNVLSDKFGIEKPGTFNHEKNIATPDNNKSSETNRGIIQINRTVWKNYSIAERLIQITLEITGLLNSPLRYESAHYLIDSRADIISKIVINESEKYNLPGWQIVGERPALFGKMSDKTILVDGGVLGQGDALNQRTLKFFNAPLADSEWVQKLIFEPWAIRDYPFFLLAGPNYDYATVTMFYLVESSKDQYQLRAYTLNFERIRTIFNGPCSKMDELSALQKIKTCLLDLNNYYSTDSLDRANIDGYPNSNNVLKALEVLVPEFRNSLLSYFAMTQETLKIALKDHFIMDYSSVIVPSKLNGQYSVLIASVKAHGLAPTLEGPFDITYFWKMTDSKSKQDVKLFIAAKTLAENGLVFLDHNIACEGFNGPILIPRKKYLELDSTNKCLMTRMGGDFESLLYKTMEDYGFKYKHNEFTINKTARE